MAPNTPDLERGPEPSRRPSIPIVDEGLLSPSSERRQSGNDLATMSDTTRTHLSEYRYHLGIHNAPDLVATDRRAAPNMGIYQRTIEAEEKYRKEYKVFSILINGALGLQIVLAGALTALGAGNGPRSAVTVFGAMNTIIAGFLAFLKGSGLPNRLKYYHNEWAKVREYIEQRERDFARGHLDDATLREEIIIIKKMYENVRKDVEANQPDSYISMSQAGRSQSVEPLPSLARGLEAGKHRLEATKHGVEEKVEERFHSTEKKLFCHCRESCGEGAEHD